MKPSRCLNGSRLSPSGINTPCVVPRFNDEQPAVVGASVKTTRGNAPSPMGLPLGSLPVTARPSPTWAHATSISTAKRPEFPQPGWTATSGRGQPCPSAASITNRPPHPLFAVRLPPSSRPAPDSSRSPTGALKPAPPYGVLANMPQPRLAAFAILGLVTITAAGLALQQYRRAEALAAQLATEQAIALTQEKELTEVRAQATHLATDAASGASAQVATDDTDSDAAASPEDRRNRRGDRPNPAAIMEKLMQNPEIAQAMRIQQNAMLDGRYAALFAKLNLPSAQLAQLKDLLAERMNVPRDVMSAARDQGMFGRGNRDELRSLIATTQSEIDQEIISTLGESTYQALQTYEDTANERRLVESLASRLSYSNTPLNSTQAEALVNILDQTTTASTRTGGRGGFGPDGGGSTPTITDATISAAQSVLSADQVSALVQLQQEQAAAAAVRNAMRAEFQGAISAEGPPPPEPPGGGD